MPGVSGVEFPPSFAKIYGKRIVIMGGGAQVGQVAMGAILEADRHNIRGERISVDTIPLVGEQELAAAVRAVVLLPRVRLLVLAGSLMGGEITRAVEDVRAKGLLGDLAEHGRQRAGRRRPRRVRPGSGRRDGGHGRRGHREVRHREAAEATVLTRSRDGRQRQDGRDRPEAGLEGLASGPSRRLACLLHFLQEGARFERVRGVERFLCHEHLLHDALRVDDERRAARHEVLARRTRHSCWLISRLASLRMLNFTPSLSANAAFAHVLSTLMPRMTVLFAVELPRRLLILRHLVRAAGRERGREEREHDVLLALEVAQLDGLEPRPAVFHRQVVGGEIGRGLAALHAGRRRRRRAQAPARAGRRVRQQARRQRQRRGDVDETDCSWRISSHAVIARVALNSSGTTGFGGVDLRIVGVDGGYCQLAEDLGRSR